MDSLARPDSPRLTALQQELAAGNHGALKRFWQDITDRGAPLIEPIDQDEQHMLVTFLWRALTPIKHVLVISPLIGWERCSDHLSHLRDTDLWYKTYVLRRDVRASYCFSPNDALLTRQEAADRSVRIATWRPDPLNPRSLIYPEDDEEPGSIKQVWSVLEVPEQHPPPWHTPRPGVAVGRLDRYRIHSARLNNDRRVWVYTLPGYTDQAKPYWLLLLLDGQSYLHVVPTPTILDNLYGAGSIPPMVAVLLDNAPRARNYELPCHEPFVDFLANEVLPWLHDRYNITSDPERAIVAGSCFGGLAAAFVALCRPDLFGNVLSLSGAFGWRPDGDAEYEWLIRKFDASPRLSLRFYLNVGQLEPIPFFGGPSMPAANQHLREVLTAKGYLVHYAEYSGAHDFLCWRATLGDGLLALAGTDLV